MKKRAIRYLRISTDRQSNFSIEGQNNQTLSWCERNNVEVVDTFTDEGWSARTFDRPDFQRLNNFIKQHHRTVDYLVVNSFDRFSREAGEAIVQIKKLQKQFAIKVVSVSEGVTFDADDPGSFFYAGLMLLKGEDEIIRNRSRINLGIFTAKKQQGRYLGAAPFGYCNARDERNKPIIVPDEHKAPVVREIFSLYRQGISMSDIRKQLGERLHLKGRSVLQRILTNKVYLGLVHMNAYKENPEEWVQGIHDAIVDESLFYAVQDKLKKKGPVTITNDAMPLRGVLKCHCGKLLTGGASRGKSGAYWNYYKCQHTGHNNISATKAHDQLTQIWQHMSLPEHVILATKDASEKLLEEKMKLASKEKSRYTGELEKAQKQLLSVEEKWVNNQMAFETYNRWYRELTDKTMALRAQLQRIGTDQGQLWFLLQNELDKLTDLHYIYETATTQQKQQLVGLGFDYSLYYQDGSYRTPSVLPVFTHNLLILKQKQLLIVETKKDFNIKVPLGGAEGSRTPVQTHLP